MTAALIVSAPLSCSFVKKVTPFRIMTCGGMGWDRGIMKSVAVWEATTLVSVVRLRSSLVRPVTAQYRGVSIGVGALPVFGCGLD